MFKKAFCVLVLSMMASTALAERASNPSEIIRDGEILDTHGERGIFRLLVAYGRQLYNCTAYDYRVDCDLLKEDT